MTSTSKVDDLADILVQTKSDTIRVVGRRRGAKMAGQRPGG